jgi:hypothetical protein
MEMEEAYRITFPTASIILLPMRLTINGPKKDEIINRQLCHFFRADIGLGMAVAAGLGVMLDPSNLPQHKAATIA